MSENQTTIPISRVIDVMLAAQSRLAVTWKDGVSLTPEQKKDEEIRDGARAALLSLFERNGRRD
jgi:hypothetical protein